MPPAFCPCHSPRLRDVGHQYRMRHQAGEISVYRVAADHTKAVALLHDSLRVGVVLDARNIVLRAYESRAPNDASASGVAQCQQVSPSLVTLACGPVCIKRPAISDAPAGLVGELCPALDARGLQLLSIWLRAERGAVPPGAPNAHGGARSRFSAGQPGRIVCRQGGCPARRPGQRCSTAGP